MGFALYLNTIRIIQDEMDDLTYVNAWVKRTEDRQAWPIEELVIRIVLTKKTKGTALNLIREWAKPQSTTTIIKSYIENYL